MKYPAPEVPYGTLDLMVLKTLAGMGPLHGYGIADGSSRRPPARSRSTRAPSIRRCSGSSRRAGSRATGGPARTTGARASTLAGRRQLTKEAALWARTVSMVNRLLEDQS